MDQPSSSHSALARIGRVMFPRRLWIGLAVVAVAALFVNPQPVFGRYQVLGTIASLGLVGAGLLGRAWAAGCAGRHTTEARIDAPKLVTGGPFAYVRNPIYFASVVLGFGMVGLVGDPVLLALHAGICIILYTGIVPAEEQFLRTRFGEDYERYCKNVPRMWPRVTPWEEAEPVSFDRRALVDQVRLGLILVAIYAGLQFSAWLRS